MEIQLLKRNPAAILPTKAHKSDVGLDLYCIYTKMILPYSFTNIDTGWDIKIPDYSWGNIKGRSSAMFKHQLLIHEGVIDPGYTGPLSVGVFNLRPETHTIFPGDRLAQLILIPIFASEYDLQVKVVASLPLTDRGPNGFGSSGN